MTIIWIGMYQETIEGFNVSGSITYYGDQIDERHFVFDPYLYNDFKSFVQNKLLYFQNLDNISAFYFYDQSFAYRFPGLNIERCICINSRNILDQLNNKVIAREWIRNHVKTPETIVLPKEEITYKNLRNIFWGYRQFVAQKMISSGGKGTYLINSDTINIESDLYMVSPYYENSIAVNITGIISSDLILTFAPSAQYIINSGNNLLFSGSDYVSLNSLPPTILDNIYKKSDYILKALQELNYRGICGIDFLIYNEDIYFLEINPRFQGSSFLLDTELRKKNLSLYKLNYDAFNNTLDQSLQKTVAALKINSSFYKDENKYRVTLMQPLVNISLHYDSNAYYDYFADKYHIMIPDWNQKIEKQGKILGNIITQYAKIDNVSTILDCTCGIGIQALSLAKEGYEVTGSDISENELDFARSEAQKRNIKISFIYADCRNLKQYIKNQYDAIISIDSALPHLLTRENFIATFKSVYSCLNIGGVFLSSYRNYDKLLQEKPNLAYPVRFNTENDFDYTILRRWIWDENIITSKQYVIAEGPSTCKLYTNTYKQWAITKDELYNISKEVGFKDIHWLELEESVLKQSLLCLVK